MKKTMYECLECGYKKLGGLRFDGTRCERCNGAIVPIREYAIGIDLAGGNDFTVINGEVIENK
jgi:uncharacterized protein with PIN domain